MLNQLPEGFPSLLTLPSAFVAEQSVSLIDESPPPELLRYRALAAPGRCFLSFHALWFDPSLVFLFESSLEVVLCLHLRNSGVQYLHF